MRSMSWKPAVEMKPVSTPLRSRTALVTTVVAPSTWSFARSTELPNRSSSSVAPCTTASAGFFGVLKTLCRCNSPSSSRRAKSVKVPPVSNASLAMVSSGSDGSAGSAGIVPNDPMNHRAPVTGIPVMIEGYEMQPEPANTSAVCRYRLCLWRRPNSLRVLAHELLDHIEKYRSDRQCGFRQRKVIRGAKRDRCLNHGARQAPDIGPGKTRSTGGDGSRKYRRTKAVHDSRAERRNRLDFGDDIGPDTRPGKALVDQAAQEVAPARQKERHIGKRRKRQRFGRWLIERCARGRHQKQLFPEQRPQGYPLDRFRAIDDGHVHLAGHDQLAQHMTKAIVDMDDDLGMKRFDLLQVRQ